MSNIFKVNLSYNFETDESKMKTSSNWEELPEIHQLDALRDFMNELEVFYNKARKKHLLRYKESLIGEALLQNMGHDNLEEGALQDDIKDQILSNMVLTNPNNK